MVVTTFTTIGYQEVHPLSHAGRIFNVGLIVVGVSLVFLGIGSLTQALLEFELRASSEGEKWSARLGGSPITTSSVARGGWESVRRGSWRGSRRLSWSSSRDEAKAEHCDKEWLTLVGDATQEQTLREVHIERARGLVAATTTDATNVYIVLTARGLNPKLKIIARASEEDAEKHLLKAGADSVVSPYLFAGQRIAQSFLRPHVVSFLDAATTRLGMDLEIGEIHVSEGSHLRGRRLEVRASARNAA